MPNFPIPDALRSHIRERALHHSSKAQELALTGFPMTVAQVQDAVLDRETQGELRDLVERKGVRTIQKYRELRLAFLREQIPELRRSIVLKVELPSAIFVQRATQYGTATTDFNISEHHYLVPDLRILEPEGREKLTTWLTRALREHRLREIAVNIVGRIIHTEDITPTMAHLHALWPLMTTLVDPSVCHYPSEREKFTKWRDKMRNPPTRNLTRYLPSKLMLAKYGPLMKAAEVQITMGMMIKSVEHKRSEAACEIEHWERVSGDIRFPAALQL